LIAFAHGGPGPAAIMLGVVLVGNLVLENAIEPHVMGAHMQIHPLVVLLVTAAGGVIGGIVGLILAVPVTVICIDLVKRLRSLGVLRQVGAAASPILGAPSDTST